MRRDGLSAERGRFVERIVLAGEEAAWEHVAEAWRPDGDTDLALAPELFAGVLPEGGAAFSDSSAYAIKIVASGDAAGVSRVLTRPFQPSPVTDRVRDAHRADLLAQADQIRCNAERAGLSGLAAIGINFLRQQAENAEFYPEYPVVGRPKTGWQGAIWVQRNGNLPGEDLMDHFSHKAPDEEWLDEVGNRGWFVVTRDRRIRLRSNELRVVKQHAVGLFLLGGKNQTRCQIIQQLVRNWPRIKEHAGKHSPPFMFIVPFSGTKFRRYSLDGR